MAVNDQVVQQWIDYFEGKFMTLPPIERNEKAFRAAKAMRNEPGNSGKEDLAAAEHYLFARWMVSAAIVSEKQMNAMSAGYDGVKGVAQLNSDWEKKMRHNPSEPTSRASVSAVLWSMKGAEDGEADRLAHNPDAAVPIWNWNAMRFGGFTDKIADKGAAITGNKY